MKTDWKPMMAGIALVSLTGAGIAGYTVVKEDIKEVETRQEEQSKQNTERYEQIQTQLGRILTHILEQKTQ